MELTDYLAALRRHWFTWVGITLAGVAIGTAAFLTTTKTYSATARVFVSASPTIPNSASYVSQRVQSYPDVADGAAVLLPVMQKLDLHESLTTLRDQVAASVPLNSSTVVVTVTQNDPREAAEIANAVADELTSVIPGLETPPRGSRPVTLTVSDPASVPVEPISPVVTYDVGLGLFVGLFLGLAVAVVRSRMDTRVYSESDVRRAWGAEPGLEVLAPRRGRARRSALTGRPATDLARRLEITAEDRRVRIVLVSPSPDERTASRVLAEDVAAELQQRGVDATVTGAEAAARAGAEIGPGVLLTVGEPLAPLGFWRQIAERYDGVVLVAPAGRVDAAELKEMRVLLRATDVVTAAVVIMPRRGRKPSTAPVPAPAAAAPATTTGTPSGNTPVKGARSADEATGPLPLGAGRTAANR